MLMQPKCEPFAISHRVDRVVLTSLLLFQNALHVGFLCTRVGRALSCRKCARDRDGHAQECESRSYSSGVSVAVWEIERIRADLGRRYRKQLEGAMAAMYVID